MTSAAHLLEELLPLLRDAGLIGRGEESGLAVVMLAADGSTRRFARISRNGRPLCLAVFPEAAEGSMLAEAVATWRIGRHLQRQGIPVPELYGWDERRGLVLVEDLGDTRLHDLVRATDFADPAARDGLLGLYRQVIDRLVAMQIDGAPGLDGDWCWDTPRYDRQLMLERESGYFLRAFWQDLLALPVPAGIDHEFAAIAAMAAEAPAGFFLHRDFQSRNIMIKDGRIRIIDYQGGRFGPLGYDLASLLIDPYADLPPAFSDVLFQHYLERLGERMHFDPLQFRRHYSLLALQRNLQIIGAFAFLSHVRGKLFFADYIRPAVEKLRASLREPIFAGQPILRAMAERAVERIGQGQRIRLQSMQRA
mgnify:CR=1 FL=1